MQFFIFWGEKKNEEKNPQICVSYSLKRWLFFQKVYQNNACIDLVWFVDFLIDP